MINKEYKRRIAYEVLIFLGLMALVMLITRLWAFLFLIILGIFVAALRLLYKRPEQVEIIQLAVEISESKSETEKDILRRAYALIQQRITEELSSLFPAAQWTWLTPDPMQRIERDEPVLIILNGAGGYKNAAVKIHNLTFKGLDFKTVETPAVEELAMKNEAPAPEREEDTPDQTEDIEENEEPVEDAKEDDSINYEYLAFEWVDSHMLRLNERINESVGQGEKKLLIPAEELPDKDSWPSICDQLIKSDFADAVPHKDEGIIVSLQQ